MIWVLLTLTLLPVSRASIQSNCDIQPAEIGEDATLEVRFCEDLRESSLVDFSIEHRRYNSREVFQMMRCRFLNGDVQCNSNKCCTPDKSVIDTFRMVIHNVSLQHVGQYWGLVSPVDLAVQKSCNFILRTSICSINDISVRNSHINCSAHPVTVGHVCNVTCYSVYRDQNRLLSMTYTCVGKEKWSPLINPYQCDEQPKAQEMVNSYFLFLLLSLIPFVIFMTIVLKKRYQGKKEKKKTEEVKKVIEELEIIHLSTDHAEPLLPSNPSQLQDQDQLSQQPAENYWLQCIKAWYPKLHTQTYFLPPLHFNRVPYSVENIAGEQVLVAQIPQDGPSQTPSIAKSRLRKQKRQTTSSSASNLLGPLENRSQVNLHLQPVYDSDVHDDNALERVLHCLRALADNSQPKEVMMVISQLQFGKYLGHPSYAATAALLPRPCTLPEHLLQQHYHEGDFDVLITHRQHGLFTLEIKSVGANFSQLKMTEQQVDDVVMKKVKEALKQLNKSEVVLKHLTSDLMDNNITKVLAMPNISSTQLLRAISRNPSDGQGLCQCLGVLSVDDALKMCLLSNQLSGKRTASDVNHIVLKDLGVWWQQLVKMSGYQPSITETVYEHLVARFCGPATTVEIHCVTAPRLVIRILGEAVFATGETMARIVLFPQQVELLNRSPPGVFLNGPPGTGKTIVLVVQGLTWLQLGHDVHVVSTWSKSRAATIVIEHQLKETMKTTTASSRVHRHQFDFMKDGEVETAVRRLKSLSEGRQLCAIADEAIHDYRKSFTEFCDQLIVQVPGVYIWGACLYHDVRPLCLEEVKLTTPLRSPPVVVREVMESEEIKKWKQVHDYTVSDVPVPTDGPAVIRLTHRDGQSGHTEDESRDCVKCGHQVARILTELDVGRTGNSNGPPPLQYRDVLVLCYDYLTDDRVDNNGQVTTTASGLVRGLRACHVPVCMVEYGDEAAIRDMALGVGDLVTVAHWDDVQGLERKVVVVESTGFRSERLNAMSRCTSQLVLIDWW